jgi:predicted nucleotidyltransferase
MKAQKETTLFTVLTGSHLYGTAGPSSDFDYKAVVLPKLDDLLLNKKVTNRKEKPEGLKAGDKMLAGETETEYLPLQVFFDDFFNGQTYALEVAFAVMHGLHEVPGQNGEKLNRFKYQQRLMTELVERFLTRNVKKMVGYAVAQSRMYGLKTERFTSLKTFLDTVHTHFENSMFSELKTETKMRETRLNSEVHADLLAAVLKLPHVKEVQVFNARGGKETSPGLEVAGKQFPLTNSWLTVYSSLKGTLENYGERVKQFDGEGVDWKALSHAMRITEQVLELSTKGTLAFPRPNALFLRAVKNGEVTLEEATAYLDTAFSMVDEAVANSVLQERTPELEKEFEEFKLKELKALYGLPTS